MNEAFLKRLGTSLQCSHRFSQRLGRIGIFASGRVELKKGIFEIALAKCVSSKMNSVLIISMPTCAAGKAFSSRDT
ncbi:MAG: hypothetical protein ACI9RO_002258 [Alteromonas macleodii]|jgi:hypothetical protein